MFSDSDEWPDDPPHHHQSFECSDDSPKEMVMSFEDDSSPHLISRALFFHLCIYIYIYLKE